MEAQQVDWKIYLLNIFYQEEQASYKEAIEQAWKQLEYAKLLYIQKNADVIRVDEFVVWMDVFKNKMKIKLLDFDLAIWKRQAVITKDYMEMEFKECFSNLPNSIFIQTKVYEALSRAFQNLHNIHATYSQLYNDVNSGQFTMKQIENKFVTVKTWIIESLLQNDIHMKSIVGAGDKQLKKQQAQRKRSSSVKRKNSESSTRMESKKRSSSKKHVKQE